MFCNDELRITGRYRKIEHYSIYGLNFLLNYPIKDVFHFIFYIFTFLRGFINGLLL
jgi:hypothetical protein